MKSKTKIIIKAFLPILLFSLSIVQASAKSFFSEPLCEGVEGAYLCYQPLDTADRLQLWRRFSGHCRGEVKNLERVQGRLLLQGELEGVFNTLYASLESAIPQSIDDQEQEAAIVYLASTNEPLDTIEDIKASVELLMSSHASINLQFFTHIGISRSPFAEGRKKNPKASMYLHSFGARIVQSIYGDEKCVMVTSPLDSMLEIFVDNLGEDNILFRCMQRSKSYNSMSVNSRNPKQIISHKM